jgi:hypothetical protein
MRNIGAQMAAKPSQSACFAPEPPVGACWCLKQHEM